MPSFSISLFISEVLQLSMPSSVVASGIMIRSRMTNIGRPRLFTDAVNSAATTTAAISATCQVWPKSRASSMNTSASTMNMPRPPASRSMSRYDTPAATRSCTGKRQRIRISA